MSLGIPGQIVSIQGVIAVIDCWGVRQEIRLDLLETPVTTGDYVIAYEGCAIRRIPAEEVLEMMAMYEAVLAEA